MDIENEIKYIKKLHSLNKYLSGNKVKQLPAFGQIISESNEIKIN